MIMRGSAPLALLAALAARTGPLRAQDPPPLPAAVTFVTSGGHWQDGAHHGHFRLIVVRADAGSTSPRLLIDWIEEDGVRVFVRESRAAAVLGEPWTLEEPEFMPAGRRTTASVFGTDPAGRHGHWTISLGPPGQFAVSPVR